MKAAVITLGLAAGALAVQTAQAGPVAGTASIVAGAVSAVDEAGHRKLLSRDDAVYSGDRIVTGRGGYVRLGFLDGGSIVLRPNSEFVIEQYRFKPSDVPAPVAVTPLKPAEPAVVPSSPAAVPALRIAEQGDSGANRSFFRLVRGGLRAISGLVGRVNHEEYAVRTTVATIGIRGTQFIEYICDAECATDPVVQQSLGSGEIAEGGLISTVDQGDIVVTSTTGATTQVGVTQVMLTTASGAHHLLPRLPGFLSNEGWLQAAQQAASTAPVPVPGETPTGPGLFSSNVLSTVPTLSGIAAAIAITTTAIVFTGDDNNGGRQNNSTTATTR